jgi:hypothetical protein
MLDMLKNTLTLHLNILPKSQRQLWDELIDVPNTFILYGGTAIALYLGHRESIDFDFFGSEPFDPDKLYEEVSFLKDSQIIQKEENTLTCLVNRTRPIQVSFFGTPKLKHIEAPFITPDNHLKIASLLDLAGTKASVVQKRAEIKDYIDIDAIIQHGHVDLSMALSAGQYLYGKNFNPEITLKSLTYYEDGNLKNLSREIRDRLSMAVKAVNLDNLPAIQ